jgi:hypothetical protein
MKWQIHEAKARFAELVDRALKEGPQTVRGMAKLWPWSSLSTSIAGCAQGARVLRRCSRQPRWRVSRLDVRAIMGGWWLSNVPDR